MITLYDHPLSPYAQKVKIALLEKGLAYHAPMPGGLGAGGAQGVFVEASPRAEVPALVDGDVRIFDSTIILEYLDDAYPDPAMRPASAAERARVRMLEEVMVLSKIRTSPSTRAGTSARGLASTNTPWAPPAPRPPGIGA